MDCIFLGCLNDNRIWLISLRTSTDHIRTFSHESVLELAKYASIPVINGLTDMLHPCQALTDLFTIMEYKEVLKGRKLVYVGDGNNM